MSQFLSLPRMHKEYLPFFLEEKNSSLLAFFSELGMLFFNPFLLSYLSNEEARLYFEDLKRINHELMHDLSKEQLALVNIAHTQQMYLFDNKAGSLSQGLSSLSQNTRLPSAFSTPFLEEEFRSLDNFLAENDIKSLSTDGMENRLQNVSDIPNELQKESICNVETTSHTQLVSPVDLQKYLLLAYLQEEQDRELFILEKNIAKQGNSINALIKNPLESQYFSADSKQESESDVAYMFDELLAKSQETAESFQFNIMKKKKKCLTSYASQKLTQAPHYTHTLEYSSEETPYTRSWQDIFSAQIPFLLSETIVFVNDNEMCIDLLNFVNFLKKENQPKEVEIDTSLHETWCVGFDTSQVVFDENILSAQYENDILKQLQQELAKRSEEKMLFSYISMPLFLFNKAFLDKNIAKQVAEHKISNITLNFLLKQK